MKRLLSSVFEKTILIGLKPRMIIITIMNTGAFVCFLILGSIMSGKFVQQLSFHNIEMETNAAAHTINSDINDISRSISMFLRNMDVKELIRTGLDTDGEADTEYVIKKSQVESYIDLMLEADCIDDIVIYLDNSKNKLIDGRTFLPASDIKDAAVSSRFADGIHKNEWICVQNAGNGLSDMTETITVPEGTNQYLPDKLIYSTRIINSDNYNNTDGLICVVYDTDHLLRQMNNTIVQPAGISILFDENDRIISLCSSQIDDVYEFHKQELKQSEIIHMRDKYWVYTAQSDIAGWRIVNITLPGSFDIRQFAIQNYRYYTVLTTILAMIWLLALIISYVYISDMVKRIRGISGHLAISKNENEFRPIPLTHSNDEIQELIIQYNRLIEQHKNSLDEMYQLGVSKRSADLKALQAQINPHFLYNTLELIDYYAFANEPEMVELIVQKLSNFYKLSLSSGKSLHSLWREIQLVQSYFDIQAMRLQGNIELTIDIPDELGQCQIPPITLQPLVENAILHGYRRGKDVKGGVLIMASKEGNTVVISVTDDGYGIDDEKLNEINAQLRSSYPDYGYGEYYGIRNINQRLKLTFGEAYGLQLKSRKSIGTTVIVKIPAS